MRLVHLSDLHLGFRQYQRLTRSGLNVREADVASAFRRAIDDVITLAPDLILLAGDIFHTVRPPNPAILHAFRQLSRVREELPGAIVVMIAGNHDMPRSTETGSILRLFAQAGVHVVEGEPRRIEFPDRELAVLAVPDVPGQQAQLRHDPQFRYNVLLMHGEVRGLINRHAMSDDRPSYEIDPADLKSSSWNYVALGHYHVFRELAQNVFYSGATDYTSTNAWAELAEEKALRIPGKGFIEFDLDSGAHTFHPIKGARAFVDLPQLSARGLTSLEVDEQIKRSVDKCAGGIDDKVVRLVVRDVPRHIARELDHSAIRAYRKRALFFHLDARRPEVVRSAGQGAPSRRKSLEDTVRDKLRSRQIDSDINQDELIELGLSYLREAEAISVAPSVADP